MEYCYPSIDLLEKRSAELDNEKKYYSLSKMIFKGDFKDKLLFPIGIDEEKNKYYINMLEKAGLFICGETGSGKSIFINDIVISLLMKNSPDELQLVFIDPRNVEFNIYKDIPHVHGNVFTKKEESLQVLKELTDIIKRRIHLLDSKKSKTINEFNLNTKQLMSHIVLVIDESMDIFEYDLASELITYILKNGCKCGVHLILATSSYLKTNIKKETLNLFDYKLSFDLASLEQAKYVKINRANLLSVYGEALVKCKDDNIVDIQVPYVSLSDIEEVVNYIKNTNN